MRSSTSLRQARESFAQSRLDGGRSAGSSASASRIAASGMPAVRPAWITATRRSTARSKRRWLPSVRSEAIRPSAS